jgi:hypothetical protein
MSNRRNHRRAEHRRSEHGPRYESHDPGKGCNSTHVARARRGWQDLRRRAARRLRRLADQLDVREANGEARRLRKEADHLEVVHFESP